MGYFSFFSVLFLLDKVISRGNIGSLKACEFAVKVNGVNKALDLSSLAGYNIVIQEQEPYNSYYIRFTPCGNNITEGCYSKGKVMASQMDGPNDNYGQGILALWDNKQTEPTYSIASNGAAKFTFEYPAINSCDQGCGGGRQLEINYICDQTAIPYNKDMSKFYETNKVNNQCKYHLDLYTKYACPISLPPTILPTIHPTINSSCQGGNCVGAIIIKENGENMTRYVVTGSPNLVQVIGNTKIVMRHNAQIQIAKNGYSNYQPYEFMEYKLLNKTLSYTTDLSQIGCSCNSAFYLVSMPGYGSNGQPTPGQYNDYYCDANQVGGVWCWEMDIQEANMYTMAVTPHKCYGSPGTYITSCDRGGCGTNIHNVNGNAMGPGSQYTINTQQPFRYSITFGNTYTIKLQQNGRTFQFESCNNYDYLNSMKQALNYGMVIVASYWGNTYQTMQWLDGMTSCGGDCNTNGQAIFYDIEIS